VRHLTPCRRWISSPGRERLRIPRARSLPAPELAWRSRKGAAKPDLSTDDGFKQAMLNAKSIGYVDQTLTAAALKSLFAKLVIADETRSKSKALNVQAAVANGDVEIGLIQISKILPCRGVELAVPLPADIQTYTTFAAGVDAAAKDPTAAAPLIKFLTAAEAAAVIKAKGMEPG